MLKKFLFTTFSVLTLSASTHASILYSDNFDTYTPGNLVGQGPWIQQGTVATNPIQVTAAGSGNVATVGNTGQDINGGFTTPLTPIDGGAIYFGLSLNVSAAQTAGDYFFGDNATTAGTNNTDRVFAKSTTGGYLLGFTSVATASTITYGTTVLTLSTTYKFVLAHNFVAGTLNDTFTLYINPTNATEADNTPYLSYTFTGTNAEPTAYGAVLLRQGSATAAPTLTVDDLVAATTFAEAAAVPEPATSTYILGGLGALALAIRRRRAV